VPGGPVGVIFDVDESTVINGVDYVFRKFTRWREIIDSGDVRTAVPRAGRTIEDQTIDLLTSRRAARRGLPGRHRGQRRPHADVRPARHALARRRGRETLQGSTSSQYVRTRAR
jgi:hypothetical protein